MAAYIGPTTAALAAAASVPSLGHATVEAMRPHFHLQLYNDTWLHAPIDDDTE